MAMMFQDMELSDDEALEMASPCAVMPDKKLLPQYPWGLRISLTQDELAKLKIDPATCNIDGMMHLHAIARVTSVSCDKRQDGTENHRVELQIEQLAVESEDEENAEADTIIAKTSRRAAKMRTLYGRESD